VFPTGLAVAAIFDGEWYRAEIIALLPGIIKVRYVDYGNEAMVAESDVRVLPTEFTRLPQLAVKMSLYGVGPDGNSWSDAVIMLPISTRYSRISFSEQTAFSWDCFSHG